MTEDIRNGPAVRLRTLDKLDSSFKHTFAVPSKRINEGEDLTFFLTSTAYRDIMIFLLQLNRSMFPHYDSEGNVKPVSLTLKNEELSPQVTKLQYLIQRLRSIIKEAPPDTGPRRFGNVAFRTWYSIVEKRVPELLREALPDNVWDFAADEEQQETLREELTSYLLGSFGSAQRLDNGTGHELSFLAFLGCLWKLGGLANAEPGVEERGIVVGIIQPYLALIRDLIQTYTLEPAGSHGVWGLDDHSFLPYIFGSAQISPALAADADIPNEGSLRGAPRPNDVTKPAAVDRNRESNMYFSAIGFIYDVKKGPFWEHSPTLYDISGIRDGWAKVNKGMVKMYNAEVLSKFPVVQHFPFGSLFRWERDPNAQALAPSTHVTSQPVAAPPPAASNTMRAPWAPTPRPDYSGPGMVAPWAQGAATVAPAGGRTVPTSASSRTAAGSGQSAQGGMPTTKAPWAR